MGIWEKIKAWIFSKRIGKANSICFRIVGEGEQQRGSEERGTCSGGG